MVELVVPLESPKYPARPNFQSEKMVGYCNLLTHLGLPNQSNQQRTMKELTKRYEILTNQR